MNILLISDLVSFLYLSFPIIIAAERLVELPAVPRFVQVSISPDHSPARLES
jgi:hypothetical protein